MKMRETGKFAYFETKASLAHWHRCGIARVRRATHRIHRLIDDSENNQYSQEKRKDQQTNFFRTHKDSI